MEDLNIIVTAIIVPIFFLNILPQDIAATMYNQTFESCSLSEAWNINSMIYFDNSVENGNNSSMSSRKKWHK